jgi:Short C-terminal domain
MNRINGWSALMSLILGVVTVVSSSHVAFAGDRRVIWETQQGYVAIVPQDSVRNVKTAPNNQPIELSEDLIKGLLGSVQLRDSVKEQPSPLFTEGSLQLVVPYLQQALREAGPGDDVAFVTVGLFKSLYGLANRPLATSGRLFYQEGKLNLILGVVKDEGQNRLTAMNRDYRLIATGSRQEATQGEWSLVSAEEQPFELSRRDWIVFDPTSVFARRAAPVAIPPMAQAVQPMKKGADRPLTERLATLNELKEKGLITDDEYKMKRREIMNEKEPERVPSERLVTLNELKKKGLITEEEYKAKRMQILSDL